MLSFSENENIFLKFENITLHFIVYRAINCSLFYLFTNTVIDYVVGKSPNFIFEQINYFKTWIYGKYNLFIVEITSNIL